MPVPTAIDSVPDFEGSSLPIKSRNRMLSPSTSVKLVLIRDSTLDRCCREFSGSFAPSEDSASRFLHGYSAKLPELLAEKRSPSTGLVNHPECHRSSEEVLDPVQRNLNRVIFAEHIIIRPCEGESWNPCGQKRHENNVQQQHPPAPGNQLFR